MRCVTWLLSALAAIGTQAQPAPANLLTNIDTAPWREQTLSLGLSEATVNQMIPRR